VSIRDWHHTVYRASSPEEGVPSFHALAGHGFSASASASSSSSRSLLGALSPQPTAATVSSPTLRPGAAAAAGGDHSPRALNDARSQERLATVMFAAEAAARRRWQPQQPAPAVGRPGPGLQRAVDGTAEPPSPPGGAFGQAVRRTAPPAAVERRARGPRRALCCGAPTE
jgi:hypothetical protein